MTDILTKIFQTATGAGYGSSSDGLEAIVRKNLSRAMISRPGMPSDDRIFKAAMAFADSMGMNPYNWAGQSAANMISSAYKVMPDIVGSAIGLPSQGSLYRNMANSASGISAATGNGITPIFNPYSVMASHNRAMDLADRVYNVSTANGGFNVDFTHGLNMSEVGTVAQRLLSSRIPYQEYKKIVDDKGNVIGIDETSPTGNTIDPQRQAEEFERNLKKFGSKINDTVSSLAKVTGSVDEAIKLLDGLSGGNFLGGTAQNASDVANKARNMAAAVRVTSAMAGMSPGEFNMNWMSMRQGMTNRFGVDPRVAAASGFSDLMTMPAFTAAMSYNTWLANNPGASIPEKMQAMLGVQARAVSWSNSSAHRMSALVAYHRNMFSDEEISRIENDLASGNPNNSLELVRNRLGNDVFTEMMNDPAAIAVAMAKGDKNTLSRFSSAGMIGNLHEAAVAGTRRKYNMAMSRTDEQLERATGRSEYRSDARRRASESALRRMAGRYGLSESAASNWDVGRLRNFLVESGADADEIDSVQYQAAINSQIDAVRGSTMSEREENEARRRFQTEIDRSGLSGDAKRELKRQVAASKDVGSVYAAFSRRMGYKGRELREFNARVTRGKMFRSEGRRLLKDLEDQNRQWAPATEEEISQASKGIANQLQILNAAGMASAFNSREFESAATDKDKLAVFARKVGELVEQGAADRGGDDKDLSKTYGEAARMMVDQALGGKLGGLERGTKEYDRFVSRVAKGMMSGNGGLAENFEAALHLEAENFRGDIGVGADGRLSDDAQKRIDKLGLAAKDGSSETGRTINAKELASRATSILNRNAPKVKVDREVAKRYAKYKRMLDNAGLSTGDVNKAMAIISAAEFEKKGGTFLLNGLKEIGGGKLGNEFLKNSGLADVMSELDKEAAGSAQNALANALGLGEGTHARAAIDEGKKQLEDLSQALSKSGLSEGVLDKILSGGGDEADRNKLNAVLGSVFGDGEERREYGMAFLKNLGKKKLGGVNGIKLLYSDQDRAAAKEKGSDEEWADLAMSSAKDTSKMYEITNYVRLIAEFAHKFMNNSIPVTLSNMGIVTGQGG